MKKETFEDFLKEEHGKDYTGCDDDMPNDFDSWISELASQQVMDFAELWGDKLQK